MFVLQAWEVANRSVNVELQPSNQEILITALVASLCQEPEFPVKVQAAEAIQALARKDSQGKVSSL